MRNRVYQIVFVSSIIIMSLLSGCGNSGSGGSSTTLNYKPGALRLAKMDGMGTSAAPTVQKTISSPTTTTTFDLGTIKASQDFYFLLSNAGDFPVTNVTITSSNGNFVVSPSAIDEVSPQNSSFILPVVKVSVIHGVALNGTGFTDSLLSMGSNTCTLTLTGKTTDSSNNVIELSYEIQINLYAEVMDVQILDGSTPIDLLLPHLTVLGIPGASGAINDYYCNVPTIKNTGNVDIDIMNATLDSSNNNPLLEQFSIHPNEEKALLYPVVAYDSKQHIYLKIKSGNTIANYNKLKIEPDGSVYIAISTWWP